MTTDEVRRELSRQSWEVSGYRSGRLDVLVSLGQHRTQRVTIRFEAAWVRLRSRAFAVYDLDPPRTLPDLVDEIMRQNRQLEFIAVGIDAEDWLVGTADLPARTAPERVVNWVARLAKMCDWWEAVFTGKDVA